MSKFVMLLPGETASFMEYFQNGLRDEHLWLYRNLKRMFMTTCSACGFLLPVAAAYKNAYKSANTSPDFKVRRAGYFVKYKFYEKIK